MKSIIPLLSLLSLSGSLGRKKTRRVKNEVDKNKYQLNELEKNQLNKMSSKEKKKFLKSKS